MDEEIWKGIKDFSDYEISNLGRIRSYKGRRLFGDPKLMSPQYDSTGRLYIKLYRNSKEHSRAVHRLVLEAFVDKCPQDCQTNHKDGNPQNNTLENLEWITPGENAIHAFRMGLRSHIGKRNPNAKLREGEVWLIKKLLYYRIKKMLICKMFKINDGHLSSISTGRNWKHIKYKELSYD